MRESFERSGYRHQDYPCPARQILLGRAYTEFWCRNVTQVFIPIHVFYFITAKIPCLMPGFVQTKHHGLCFSDIDYKTQSVRGLFLYNLIGSASLWLYQKVQLHRQQIVEYMSQVCWA